MIVLDASVVVEILLQTKDGKSIESRILRSSPAIAAPQLLDVEVCQVLRKYFLSKELSNERALEAIDDLTAFPIHRYPHESLVHRVWELRNNLTAYDAIYVALTEQLKARLITRDKRMGQFAKKWVKVEIV